MAKGSSTSRCFNGHTFDTPGCFGCHHAFHVTAPGQVSGGRLLPPAVTGPDECDLCHEARHEPPVPGCDRCEGRMAESVTGAIKAWEPVRQEAMNLRMQSWLLGWQATLAGWAAVATGTAWGGWFREPDGGIDLGKEAVFFLGLPLVQWALRKQAENRERSLPRLGPQGELRFGEEEGDPEDSS